MMTYTLLIVLFIAVFGLLAWRIVIGQARVTPVADDLYTCPICNDQHCECLKKNDSSR